MIYKGSIYKEKYNSQSKPLLFTIYKANLPTYNLLTKPSTKIFGPDFKSLHLPLFKSIKIFKFNHGRSKLFAPEAINVNKSINAKELATYLTSL